jgi:hypothetical protein
MRNSSAFFLVFALPLVSGCNSIFGMPDQMADMQQQMNTLNQKIGTVEQASHDQVLDGAIKDMFDANNTLSLSAPAAMMPAAKIYADTATDDELIQYAFVLMSDINQGTPDPSLQNSDGSWPAAVVAQFDNHKAIERTILVLIAGLAAEDKVERIVHDQIDAQGLYQGTTYSFLMFRYIGIETVILPENDLTKLNQSDNLATIQDTYTQLQALDYIRGLPYLSQLSFSVLGMLDTSMNMTLSLGQTDLDYPTTEYRSLKSFIQKLDPRVLATPQARALLGGVNQRLKSN